MRLLQLLLIPMLAALPHYASAAGGEDNGYHHFDLQLCLNHLSAVAQHAPATEAAPYLVKREAVMRAIQRASEGYDNVSNDEAYAIERFREWTLAYDAAAVEDRVIMILEEMKKSDDCAVLDAEGKLVAPADDDD